MAKYLITGAAGFIGFHTSKKLLARGDTVVGYDNLVPYYPVEYKHARLKQLVGQPGFTFQQADLTERERLMQLWVKAENLRLTNMRAAVGRLVIAGGLRLRGARQGPRPHVSQALLLASRVRRHVRQHRALGPHHR